MTDQPYGRPLRRSRQRKQSSPDKDKKSATENQNSRQNKSSAKESDTSHTATTLPRRSLKRDSRERSSGKSRTDRQQRDSKKSSQRGRPPSRKHDSRQSSGSRKPSSKRPSRRPTSGITLESIALPILTIMAATAFLYYAAPILVPLIAAIALAFVLAPVVNALKNVRVPHGLAVALVMLAGAIVLVVGGYVIFQESAQLANEMPGYYQTVKGWLADGLVIYQSWQAASGGILPELEQSALENVTFSDISGVGGYLFKGLGSVLSSFFGIIMIVLLTLFILLDQQGIHKRLLAALGGNTDNSAAILRAIDEQLRGFLQVKFITTIALAVVFTVGLLIMDVSYAYVWGPLAAALNLIPYIGSIIGMVPPAIMAGVQTGGIVLPLWVVAFFVIIQLVESNVITPKLVGDKVNLNLLAVLLSTVYWGWLWGMVGVLLAVPITAAVKVICAQIQPLRPIAVVLGGDPDTDPALVRK